MTHIRHCLSLTLKALVFVVRVICGDNDTEPGAGKERIFAGQSVWGYPRCPTPADIKFMITEEKRWSVDATLEDKFCVKAPVRLAGPEVDSVV